MLARADGDDPVALAVPGHAAGRVGHGRKEVLPRTGGKGHGRGHRDAGEREGNKAGEESHAATIIRPDGLGDNRQIACGRGCPVDCITSQAAEREDGRRYPEAFRINFNRCIFCGLCAEACPTLALQMSTNFEMAETDSRDLIYEKHDLLVDHGGKYPDYSFWEEAGVAVTHALGYGKQDKAPSDPRSNLP